MAEEIAIRMKKEVWREGNTKQTKHALIQHRAKERKQAQHRREKDCEILAGLQSPGTTNSSSSSTCFDQRREIGNTKIY